MANDKLVKPLLYDTRISPRDIIPNDWADSLRLDYLGKNEASAEIAARVVLASKELYALQASVENAVAEPVSDSVATAANASFTDIGAATGSYVQVYAQQQTDAINELKLQLNTAIATINALVVTVNESLATEREAGLRK